MKRANRTTRITGELRKESLRLVGRVNALLAQVIATAVALRNRRVLAANVSLDAFVGQGWAHNAGQALHDLRTMLWSRRPEVLHEVKRRLRIACDAVNATCDHFCELERRAKGIDGAPVTREQLERPSARKRTRQGLGGVVELVDNLKSGAVQSTRPDDPHFNERLRAALRGESADLPPPPRPPRITQRERPGRKRGRAAVGRRDKHPPRSGASPPEPPREPEEPPAPEAPDPFPGGVGRVPNNPELRTAFSAVLCGGRNAGRIVGGWSSGPDGVAFRHEMTSRPGRCIITIDHPDPGRVVQRLEPLVADVLVFVVAAIGEAWNRAGSGWVGASAAVVAEDVLRAVGCRYEGRRRAGERARVARAMDLLASLRSSGSYGGESWASESLFTIKGVEEGARADTAWHVTPGPWEERWVKGRSPYIHGFRRLLLELPQRHGRARLAKRIGQYIEMLPPSAAARERIAIRSLLAAVGGIERGRKGRRRSGRVRTSFRAALRRLHDLGLVGEPRYEEGAGNDDPYRRRGWFERWLDSIVTFEDASAGAPVHARARPRREVTSVWKQVLAVRLALGLTQADVARESGIAASYLSLLESGKRRARRRIVARANEWLRAHGEAADRQ